MFNWKSILVVMALLLLAGCDNDEIKKTLQTGFDNSNPSGERGVCFGVGKVDYPYITKEVTGELDEDGYNEAIDRNNILNKRLAMFARLGLLSETPALDDNGEPTGFYHYDFTDEGKKYKGYYLGKYQVFCFGRVVVDSTDIKWTTPEKEYASVIYNYHVEGEVPDWAKSPELNLIRRFAQNDKPIDWSDRKYSWFFKQTSNGLKPVVTPGVFAFGI